MLVRDREHVVADQHRHRDRLAERATQAEHDWRRRSPSARALAARPCAASPSASRRVASAASFSTTGAVVEDLAADRGDDRQHHDREHDARPTKYGGTEERARRTRQPISGILEPAREVDPRPIGAQRRHEREDAPEAVDHARDRREAGRPTYASGLRSTRRSDIGDVEREPPSATGIASSIAINDVTTVP